MKEKKKEPKQGINTSNKKITEENKDKNIEKEITQNQNENSKDEKEIIENKNENQKEEEKNNIIIEENIQNNNNNLVEEKNLKSKNIQKNEINNILEIKNEEYIPEIIGKLLFSPLVLFTFKKNNNSIHVHKFTNIPEEFKKLNITSSYCNGVNKLFISGGIDSESENKPINKLWIIDLNNFEIENPIDIKPKNNHNMIFIPEKYIFIVGGNDNSTFYYDLNDKKINEWGNLNKNRSDPALIQIDNYLYVFDNNFEISIERTNLLSNDYKWELINPGISGDTLTNSCQKYFGICKESNDSIIFLGGYIPGNDENIKQLKNQRYNIKKNLIEYSDVPYSNILLKEKKFLSFNDKNDIFYMMTDFSKKCPKIAFYIKSRNEIKIIDYSPKEKKKYNKDENRNKRDNEIIDSNFSFKNIDFNMPKEKI